MKKFKFWFNCVCLMLPFIIPCQSHATETAALVSDVTGHVTIKANGSSSPAKLLTSIPLGAKVDLAAGAKLTMIYVAKGDEYNLTGPGVYQLDASSPQTINGAAPTSISGALTGKKIRLGSVTQASSTMREGIKETSGPLGPLTPSDSITLADPLQLRWHAPADGLAYSIQIINSKNEVLFSKEMTGNTFTLPAGIPLSSGSYYIWNITTTMPDGSPLSDSAKFKVASSGIREQAAKLKPGKNGAVSERVTYGLWLEGANLADEAIHVWVDLAEDYTDEPNIRDRANPKP